MQTFLAIALLLTIWLSPLLAQPQPNETTPTASRTEIILLGTGTPYPDPNSFGPATAVVVDGRVFLFDAGAGVMRRMNAAKLPLSGPEAVFITHLHSDHTLGYADLILTSWIMRRAKPFPVYGPPGLRRMTDHLLAAFAEDIEIRTNGLEHEVAGGYRVDVTETRAGLVYEKDGVRVTAIAVPHGAWKHAFGYRIDTPDRSIVISGDTRPSEELVKAARERLARGFRDNTWFVQTKGTDYELVPPASKKVPLVRTIYAEADGVALPDPDPTNVKKREFGWMISHRYAPDKAVTYPFKDYKSLQSQKE